MVSRRGMQEHMGYIHDATGQRERNLSMPQKYIMKKWIHAGKNTQL